MKPFRKKRNISTLSNTFKQKYGAQNLAERRKKKEKNLKAEVNFILFFYLLFLFSLFYTNVNKHFIESRNLFSS